MAAQEPNWWYATAPQWQTTVLRPVSHIYAALAARHIRSTKPYVSKLPIVCIGNFTAGGTGKTPTSLKVAAMLRDLGFVPIFLSRGYGGSERGPIDVDVHRHSAGDVGDEPLLLAQAGRAVVARDRTRGVQFIEAAAPAHAVIVMDDGLQNPSVAKTLSLAVVDANRGLGNGAVIPAGPLRAAMSVQAPLADAVILNGTATAERMSAVLATLNGFRGPVFHAHVAPAERSDLIAGERLVAFAGIANPERFFALASASGATLADRIVFRDHHDFTAADVDRLIAAADRHGAKLITTEKDAVRMRGMGEAGARILARTRVLAIEMQFAADDEARLKALLIERLGGMSDAR